MSALTKASRIHMPDKPQNWTFDFRSANEKPLLQLTDYATTEERFANSAAFGGIYPAFPDASRRVLTKGKLWKNITEAIHSRRAFIGAMTQRART